MGAVCQVDATPFRQWYVQHYGGELGKKTEDDAKVGKGVAKKREARLTKSGPVDASLGDQFRTGRLFAKIASRPGQHGRVDGYILEGSELAFYLKKMAKKKGKGKD
mmetsp:Transcript_28926/g.68549  ORF Transcript_28926/g.68549 Transcript_28926/m.68549 type:complete len:106 (-) Transcript_28926:192-509(-)